MTVRLRAAALALGALLVAGTGMAACGTTPTSAAATVPAPQAAKCPSDLATVTVQGYGTAEGTPNLVTLSLGVQTQALSAAAALNENSAKAHALIAKLTRDGVAKKDMQTSELSVQPVYGGPKSRLTGYQVTNTLTVTIRNLAKDGKIIDDAAGAAGNSVRVDNISFSIQDDTVLLGRARAAAVRQATGQAHDMASAAGLMLGPLCSLQDNTSEPTPQPVQANYAAAGAPASVPVEAGSLQVTADVTAVYQLVSR